jgi:hypothetical protein
VAERVGVGDPVTYTYGKRTVRATVERCERVVSHDGLTYHYFMPRPVWEDRNTTPVSQLNDYEGITWERGWTDGVALLAAHALAGSR